MRRLATLWTTISCCQRRNCWKSWQTRHEWSTTVSWFHCWVCWRLYWQCTFDFEREFDDEESLCTMGAAHVIIIIIIIIFIRSWQTATNYKNELIDQSINAFVQHSENEISQLINWCRHIEQSVCLWTCNSIASCAQTVHALRLLRSNGMSLECIYTVYIERSSSPSSPYTHL